MNKCDYCEHSCKRNRMTYCKENRNYPPQRLINLMGCSDFKERYVNLFNWNDEEDKK